MLGKDRTQRTYIHELWRAGSSGILETAGTTFLLLIALQHFSAGSTAKGLVYIGGSLGLILCPLVVTFVSARGWKAATAGSRILMLGALAFLVSALIPTLPVFVICSMIGMAASAVVIPLVTQVYQENYPASERGKRFSRTVMIRIVSGALFGVVAGAVLSEQLDRFPILLFTFAGAMAFAAFCLGRCPSQPITSDGGVHPLRALRFVVHDPHFKWLLISWMGMGFANLMMLPLRVEYLGNEQYGLQFTPAKIAFLTIVIPSISRLIMSPIWGYLFDRMNFFLLRAILNLGFAIAIMTFFFSESWAGMVVGAVIYGVSNAGGEVVWGLWVTKLARPERVADYMSVHTFMTGLRGVVAPMLGFHLSGQFYSIHVLAWISIGLILVSTSFLIGRKLPQR